MTAVLGGVQHRLRRLFRQARHEKEVEPATPRVQRGGQGGFQGLVVVWLAEGAAHGGVMCFRRDLQRPIGEGLAHPLQVAVAGGVEQLHDHRAREAANRLEEALSVAVARLTQVSQDEHGAFAHLGHAVEVAGQLLWVAIGRALPLVQAAEGLRRATAGEALLGAATTGKRSHDGIIEPAFDGFVVLQIPSQASRCRPHHVAVIQRDVVEVSRAVGERVFVHLAVCISPGEVGHLGRRAVSAQALQELAQRFLRRIASYHVVHLRVVEEFPLVVGGREAAEDHRSVWVMLLDQLGDGQRAVGVG